MIEADLHSHSHHSDGTDAPKQLVAKAARIGLRALALTDHDTLDGIAEARSAAPPELQIVAGVELSSRFRDRDIHLLAYDVEPDDDLNQVLEPFRRQRLERARRMVERLNRLGVPVTMEEVDAIANASSPRSRPSIGRPHIAEAIVRHGAAAGIEEAFSTYLRRGRPAFVDKDTIGVDQALRLVRSRGGSLVVAHPGLDLSEEETEALVLEGLDGIEVWHPNHDERQRRRLLEITRRHDLVASGGSDYHGTARHRHELGQTGVTLEALERLRESGRRRRL